MIQILVLFKATIILLLLLLQFNCINSQKLSNNCDQCSGRLEFDDAIGSVRLKRDINAVNDKKISDSTTESHTNDPLLNNSTTFSNRSVIMTCFDLL